MGGHRIVADNDIGGFHQLGMILDMARVSGQGTWESTLLARDLGGLPVALVLVAGYDVLHDEGVLYADKLATAGNPTVLVEYASLPHGFISMSGVVDASVMAVDQVGMALRRALQA